MEGQDAEVADAWENRRPSKSTVTCSGSTWPICLFGLVFTRGSSVGWSWPVAWPSPAPRPTQHVLPGDKGVGWGEVRAGSWVRSPQFAGVSPSCTTRLFSWPHILGGEGWGREPYQPKTLPWDLAGK